MSIHEMLVDSLNPGQIILLSILAVSAYLVGLAAFLYLIDDFLDWLKIRKALREEEP